jgi:membrane protein YdbS with pleckstrin-like domain
MSTPRVYESAVDPWFYPALVVAPWTVTALLVYFTSHTLHGVWVGAIVGIVVLVAVRPFTRPCRYTLSDETLKIESGFLKIVMPLSKVQKAEQMRSFLAAPCLSIDRVLVTATDAKEMISPADRQAFIADLISRAKVKNG